MLERKTEKNNFFNNLWTLIMNNEKDSQLKILLMATLFMELKILIKGQVEIFMSKIENAIINKFPIQIMVN